jgi:hypothetical protein
MTHPLVARDRPEPAAAQSKIIGFVQETPKIIDQSS